MKDFKRFCLRLSLWGFGLTASAASARDIVLPVSKDSSVIQMSYCCGMAADRNFGSSPTVDAGQYHHQSQALFGFNVSALEGWHRILKAQLIIRSASLSGSNPATFHLGKSMSEWDESTVTWNNRPLVQQIGSVSIQSGQTILDVTQAFSEAYSLNKNLTLSLDSIGMANVFIDSKEKNPDSAVYLLITTNDSVGGSAMHSLTAKHSGKCLDVSGPSPASGAKIHQWSCHGGSNQKFWLSFADRNSYALVATHSNKCADVANGSQADGAQILQWDCHFGANQRVRLESLSDGAFRLVFVHSNKCLEGSGSEDGANVQQAQCIPGAANQEWFLQP